MSITTVSAPIAKAGEEYNWCFQLSGEFELTDFDAPAGLTVTKVGQSICTRGTMTAEDGIVSWRAEITQNCGLSQTIVSSITIEAACDAGCTYYWSIIPTITVPGATVTTSFTPPPGCPPDVTLSLDLFMADGVTPILIEGVAASITIPAGSTTRVNEYADRNTVVVFKPSAIQQKCVGCCVPSISSQKRVVIDAPPCTINWLVGTQQFTENVGAPQTYYSNNIPPNCSVRFQLYIGASLTPETYGDFTLTHDQPFKDVGILKFPFGTAGVDFNYRPDAPVGAGCQNCLPSPARIDIDVAAGATCGINWSLQKVSFVAGAPNVNQIYSATGIPPGCSIRFDLYIGNVIQGYGDFTLSADQPSLVTSVGFPATGVTGLDFNYRPALPLIGECLSAQCSITPARIDFDVTAGAVCGINWDLLVKTFVAGTPQDQTYSGTGFPAGCSVAFDWYDGNTLLTASAFTLSDTAPSVTVSALNFPAFSIGSDYNFRPVTPLVGACSTCAVSPARIDFDVTAGAACGGIMTATAGGCNVAPPAPPTPPAPSPGSSNTCVVAQTETATSANSSGGTFPITLRNSTAVNEYSQVVSTKWTSANPGVNRFVVPFTILPGSTTVGATNMPYISETAGVGAQNFPTRISISRNPCDFAPSTSTPFVGVAAASHSVTLSINDATLAGGGQVNLTNGQWYLNIEMAVAPGSSYNVNRIVDVTWVS
jgi:hypothetical protein